jgi:hypothetical protein
MTRDEYFAEVRRWPWGFFGSFALGVPKEWIAEAWDLPEVQAQLVAGGYVLYVSKTGSLCHDRDHLNTLSECLGSEQVRRFYLTIREANTTREVEFRPEFLDGFARHAKVIPPALTEEELAASMGFTVEELRAHDDRLRAEAVPPSSTGDAIPF